MLQYYHYHCCTGIPTMEMHKVAFRCWSFIPSNFCFRALSVCRLSLSVYMCIQRFQSNQSRSLCLNSNVTPFITPLREQGVCKKTAPSTHAQSSWLNEQWWPWASQARHFWFLSVSLPVFLCVCLNLTAKFWKESAGSIQTSGIRVVPASLISLSVSLSDGS